MAVRATVEGLEGAGGSEALPVEGVAEGAEPEGGEELEIRGDAVEVPGLLKLVEEGVADAVDGGFHAAPKFE